MGTALSLTPATLAALQQPTFRSTVDLVAVEVQVVDSEGFPIEPLGPEQFEVTIAGRKRRVLSADYIRSTQPDGGSLSGDRAGIPVGAPVARNRWPTTTESVNPSATPGRIYILAFDVGSLTVGDSRAVVESAMSFIDRLQPNDKVGLYTFPVGARIEPTLEHGDVRRLVNGVVGSTQNLTSEYNLTASEIIDINAEAARMSSLNLGRGGQSGFTQFAEEAETLRKVQVRECGGLDARCAEGIQAEAQSLAFYLEGRANEGLNGLRALIGVLSSYEGRKTVVMFSSGIPTSDRPGGRPDLGDLAKVLGQDAAATNTTIYTLHVDTSAFRVMSAEAMKGDRSPSTRSRDNAVLGRTLDEFSGASGGALLRVLVGKGEYALDRVLRETSSHYLLGVQPDEADRDGKVRELRVKVNRRGATVRSRLWVVVPRRAGA
jgi:VWFA-related protein